MTQIILDTTASVHFQNQKQPVELRDQTGRLLGHFIPVLKKAISPAMEPRISEEELDRREQQGGGRPLRDILADLENRG